MKRLTLKQRVIIHFAYRDVFNAPIHLAELKNWLGGDIVSLKEIEKVLSELIKEGAIETMDGFRYCIKGRSKIFDTHALCKEHASEIFKKDVWPLKILSFVPLIRYVGISGSVAAGNATPDIAGDNKGHVDLDVFMITSPSCLWIVFFIERCFANFCHFWRGNRHTYCFNYAMDATFLEVHNKNLFTATEIYNLKTVFNKGKMYEALLCANSWTTEYYPTLVCEKDTAQKLFWSGFFSSMLSPVNFFFYILFQLGRAVKHQSLKPLFSIGLNFSVNRSCNYERICSENGGYEGPVYKQFQSNLQRHFKNYYSGVLVQAVFPIIERSADAYDVDEALFYKYTYRRA